MKRILAQMLIAGTLAAQAVQSPLASFDDYIFSEPVHTNFITGVVMGANPVGYCPVRGEDQIYLYEAYREMYSLLSAQPSTLRTRAPGIDTAYLRLGSALYYVPAYNALYNLFGDATNQFNYVLTLPGVAISMPTNLIPLRNYYSYPYNLAQSAAIFSGAAVTNRESLRPLAYFSNQSVRYLAATNVAAYYAQLANVAGLARDFNVTDGTNSHTTTIRDVFDAYTYNNGQFEYQEIVQDTSSIMIGGGFNESTDTQTGLARIYRDGSYHVSRPLYRSRIISGVFDDPILTYLYSTSMVRAAQITPRKGWVQMLAKYYRYETQWTTPSNNEYVVSISTNFLVVGECQVQVAERGDSVVAILTPDYMAAYHVFVDGTGLEPPDDVAYPVPPSATSVFGPDETGSRYNDTSTTLRISPVRSALALDIDWHTGFTHLNSN